MRRARLAVDADRCRLAYGGAAAPMLRHPCFNRRRLLGWRRRRWRLAAGFGGRLMERLRLARRLFLWRLHFGFGHRLAVGRRRERILAIASVASAAAAAAPPSSPLAVAARLGI